MEKRKVGRYTLQIYSDKNRGYSKIPIDWAEVLSNFDIPKEKVRELAQRFNGKDNVPLQLIDLLTLQYLTKEDFYNKFIKKNEIFQSMFPDLIITYNEFKEKKTLEPIFNIGQYEGIKDLALEFIDGSALEMDDSRLYRVHLQNIIYCMSKNNDPYLTRYINAKNIIPPKIMEVYMRWATMPNELNHSRLASIINNYKFLRTLKIYQNRYEQNKADIIKWFDDKDRAEKERADLVRLDARLKVIEEQLGIPNIKPNITEPLFNIDSDNVMHPNKNIDPKSEATKTR